MKSITNQKYGSGIVHVSAESSQTTPGTDKAVQILMHVITLQDPKKLKSDGSVNKEKIQELSEVGSSGELISQTTQDILNADDVYSDTRTREEITKNKAQEGSGELYISNEGGIDESLTIQKSPYEEEPPIETQKPWAFRDIKIRKGPEVDEDENGIDVSRKTTPDIFLEATDPTYFVVQKGPPDSAIKFEETADPRHEYEIPGIHKGPIENSAAKSTERSTTFDIVDGTTPVNPSTALDDSVLTAIEPTSDTLDSTTDSTLRANNCEYWKYNRKRYAHNLIKSFTDLPRQMGREKRTVNTVEEFI